MAAEDWDSKWSTEMIYEGVSERLRPAATLPGREEEDIVDFSAPDSTHDNRPINHKQEFELFDGKLQDQAAKASNQALIPDGRRSESKEAPNLNDAAQGVVFGETLNEMMLRLSNEFAPINEVDADTLIYIGPPPRSARQDDYDYSIIQAHFKKPYLMRSSTLKALKSSKFDKFLGPMSARTERRLKKLGIHVGIPNSEKIKYYIDLRPDIEGDEGLILLTELTSTPGVLNWHRNASRFQVDPRIVAGTDELNAPPKPRYDFVMYDEITLDSDEAQEEPSSPSKRRKKSNVDGDRPQWPRAEDKLAQLYNRPIGEDYSPLRHHSAIERLLHAIAGDDPKLDSAPKAWTFCAVASYFDCSTNPRINAWLISWLLASANANFVQANPEVVYRMAVAMQSPGLLRCTFAMLVGEKALQKAMTEKFKSVSKPKKTVHGRVMCNIDDDDINRVDHAIPSLTNRAIAVFERLIDPLMQWTLLSVERRQLEYVEVSSEKESALVSKAKELLVHFVRRRILTATIEELIVDTRRPKLTTTKKPAAVVDAYNGLSPSLRLLTQSFWIKLAGRGFYTEQDWPEELTVWQEQLPYLHESGLLAVDDDIPFVNKVQLFSAFDEVNSMIRAKYHANNPFRFKGKSIASDKIPKPAQGLDEYGRTIRGPDTYSRPLPIRQLLPHLPPPRHQMARPDVATSVGAPQQPANDRTTDVAATFEDLDSDWSAEVAELTQFPLPPQDVVFPEVPAEAPDAERMHHQQGESSKSHPKVIWKFPPSKQDSSYIQIEYPAQSFDTPEPLVDIDPLESGAEQNYDALPTDRNKAGETEENEYTRSKLADFFHDDRTRELKLISAPHLLTELTIEMREIIDSTMILPGYVVDKTCEWDIPIDENDTLLCLTDDEWKYLPLWAGGLDDGTGGVFDDGVEVPDAPDVDAGGFRGGVMGLHSALNSDAGSTLGSDFEEIQTEVGISTVGKASRNATDGTVGGSTVMSLDE